MIEKESHYHISKKADEEILKARRNLKIALAFTAIFLVVEIIGGFLANSLALLADATHMGRDALALVLSLIASYFSLMDPTEIKTYGYKRIDVLVAFINGLILIVIASLIFIEGLRRTFKPEIVLGFPMLIVATLGLFANLFGLYFLNLSKENVNVKSAFLHMMADTLSSIGVVVGSIIIYLTGVYLVDPFLSILIAGIILITTVNLLRETFNILLQGIPKGVSLKAIKDTITNIPNVRTVHDLHIWSLSPGSPILTAHVLI